MQALESLNDSQVNDFLSGKAPLNLTMRLGDHMMLIQLQLSTVIPTTSSGTKRSLSKPSSSSATKSIKLHHNKSTKLISIVNDESLLSSSSILAAAGTNLSTSIVNQLANRSSSNSGGLTEVTELVDPDGFAPSPVSTAHCNPTSAEKSLSKRNVGTRGSSQNESNSSVKISDSDSGSVSDANSFSSRSISSILAEALTESLSSSVLQPCVSCPVYSDPSISPSFSVSSDARSPASPISCPDASTSNISSRGFPSDVRPSSPGSLPSPCSSTTTSPSSTPTNPASPGSSTSSPSSSPSLTLASSSSSSSSSTSSSSSCRCYPSSSSAASPRPTLDTRALVEASRNLTQTLKQLSSEVLTSKPDPAAEVTSSRRRQGAIIESMHHHGKGVYSGTFSGTLNPALQDRFGRPKRDISTIIHILNDLLCATPQYRASRSSSSSFSSCASPSASAEPTAAVGSPSAYVKTFAPTSTRTDSSIPSTVITDPTDALTESIAESLENQATRGKMERLRMIMEERRERRKARRSAPYNKNNSLNPLDSDQQHTHWSAKSETQSVLPDPDPTLPLEGEAPVCSELSPEPVVA
nr:PREDICTED: midnolin-like isoform X2 [Bemisia tabaci]